MIAKTMMTAAFALALATGPALAQDSTTAAGQSSTVTTTPPGGTGSMQTMPDASTQTTMPDTSMPATSPDASTATTSTDTAGTPAPTMSKSDTATMQKCQAMSADAMAKSHKCQRFAKAHPDMMQSAAPATAG